MPSTVVEVFDPATGVLFLKRLKSDGERFYCKRRGGVDITGRSGVGLRITEPHRRDGTILQLNDVGRLRTLGALLAGHLNALPFVQIGIAAAALNRRVMHEEVFAAVVGG